MELYVCEGGDVKRMMISGRGEEDDEEDGNPT